MRGKWEVWVGGDGPSSLFCALSLTSIVPVSLWPARFLSADIHCLSLNILVSPLCLILVAVRTICFTAWPSFVSRGCCSPPNLSFSQAALCCRASRCSQALSYLECSAFSGHLNMWKIKCCIFTAVVPRCWGEMGSVFPLLHTSPPGCLDVLLLRYLSSPRVPNRPLCLQQSLHPLWHTIHLWNTGTNWRGEWWTPVSLTLLCLLQFLGSKWLDYPVAARLLISTMGYLESQPLVVLIHFYLGGTNALCVPLLPLFMLIQ